VVEHLLPTARKVLLVGAQDGLREAVETSLPKTRFEVSSTPTGAVALELAWHTRYDAIVVSHPLVDRPTARFLAALRAHGCACRTSAVVRWSTAAASGGPAAAGAGASQVSESTLARARDDLRVFKISPRVSLSRAGSSSRTAAYRGGCSARL
jgi:DNA-binding NarL/FixJ family response regulator